MSYTNRGLLLGDLAEFATKTSIGKGLFDTNMTPERQLEYIIEIVRPKAEFIDGVVIGNHEGRGVNLTSIDIMKLVCNTLNIPYLHYTGYVKYAWNNVAYVAKLWHGAGGGATAQTAINCCENMAKRSLADINIIGHFHKLLKSDRVIEVPDLRNMKTNKMHMHHVVIGSALEYNDGYADMTGLDERDLGFPTISLRGVKGKKEVKVTL